MRICAISAFPPTRAGVADYGAHLAHRLADDPRVEQVTVLADRGPECLREERAGKVEVHRVWTRNSPRIGPALVRSVRALRPDVVWFNLGITMFGTRLVSAAGGLLAPLCTTRLGYRTVVTLHEVPAITNLVALGLRAPSQRMALSLVPPMVLRADRVVVTLAHYRRYLRERHGARNVGHIAHGAYGEPQCPPEPEQESVLVFGTFGPHKDPGLVVDAVARLRRSRPGLRLVVAGADHPRFPGFMQSCSVRYGLDGSWIGYVPADQLSSLFASATVVVIPPRASTGSSGVMYRAMSHGRAVLASDLFDYRLFAADEGFDLVWFEPGNAASLAASLEALLDDRQRRRDMIARNVESMERLRPSRIVDAYIAEFAGYAAQPDDISMPPARELAPAAAGGGD